MTVMRSPGWWGPSALSSAGPGSEGPPMMGDMACARSGRVAPGIGELRDYESVGIFRHWGWDFVAGQINR